MFTEKIRWVGSLATLGIVGALALSACGGAEAPVGAPAAAPTAAAVAPTAVPAAPTTAPAAATSASANMLPAEAAAAVTTAITAAKANNMADAKKSLQAALAQTTDPAQKNALNEVLDDIDKGKTDEVAPDLEKLLAGGAPGREQMETALAAAQKSDWATVKSEVTEAVGIVTDPALKNGLNEILDDLAKNKTDEVASDLQKLLK